ncbi:hypothetical protein D0Z06_05155 [Geodermatophilus marinus]|nr:hypothetical protein D0Z06_05155 [Geodermatophilus sp. LHW52908]
MVRGLRSAPARTRTGARRPPRPDALPQTPAGARRPRPASAAAASGVLVAAQEIHLAYLLWEPEPGWHWYLVALALPIALAVLGAALVWRGRPRGWQVLAAAAALPLLGVLGLAGLFAALGGGRALPWALLLLVGPLAALVLATRRPVREWTAPRRATRRPRPPRTAARAR